VLVGRIVLALVGVRVAMLGLPPWRPLFSAYVLSVLALCVLYGWTTLGAPRIDRSVHERFAAEEAVRRNLAGETRADAAPAAPWCAALRDLRDPALLGAMVAAGWAVWALVG
jgi:hypothetical protein